MNWGKGLAIAMGSFIVFIVILGVGLMSHTVDLESEDYYQRELAYGNEIEAIENALNSDVKVDMEVLENHIVFKQSDSNALVGVNIEFKRPDSEKDDLNFTTAGEKQYLIRKDELKPGMYNVSITYERDNEPYQQNVQIYL